MGEYSGLFWVILPAGLVGDTFVETAQQAIMKQLNTTQLNSINQARHAGAYASRQGGRVKQV